MKTEGRLRWAIFTNSVVSAVENPDAHLWRALGRVLRRDRHEATFYEPRGNDAVRALLQRSGSGALSEFRGQHPDIEYRTLEPRRGAELVEWMTRTLATADVALVPVNASGEIINWLGKLTRPHLQTFVVDTGWNGPAADRAELGKHLTGFSAIALGDKDLAETYSQIASGAAIINFGPLPSPNVSQSEALDAAAKRLIEGVVAARVDTSSDRKAPLSPNGHRPD